MAAQLSTSKAARWRSMASNESGMSAAGGSGYQMAWQKRKEYKAGISWRNRIEASAAKS